MTKKNIGKEFEVSLDNFAELDARFKSAFHQVEKENFHPLMYAWSQWHVMYLSRLHEENGVELILEDDGLGGQEISEIIDVKNCVKLVLAADKTFKKMSLINDEYLMIDLNYSDALIYFAGEGNFLTPWVDEATVYSASESQELIENESTIKRIKKCDALRISRRAICEFDFEKLEGGE